MSHRPGPRRPRGGSAAPFGVVLYLLATAGGLWLGVQAYAMYGGVLPGAPAAPPSPAAVEPSRSARPTPPDPPGEAEEPEGAPAVAVRPAGPRADPLPPVEIDRAGTGRPEVALTFDAGADWRPTKQILDALLAEGVKCTFFLTGEWVRENPRTTRRIALEGHELANHSWDHADFTKLSDAAIRDQLRRTDAEIRRVTGHGSRPYFRPPLGARDDRVRRLVGEEGFFTVYWTLDSHDAVVRDITASQVRDRVVENAGAGAIVLLHCGSRATAEAVPEILAGLKEKGLQPVPLNRLLAK